MKRIAIVLGCTALWSAPPLFAAPTTDPVPRPARSSPPTTMTLADCHDAAAAHLAKICEDYRRLKAMELSQLRDLAYEDAYANVQSVMPVLRPINRPLLVNRLTQPGEVLAHKREVELVESEVQAMAELAERLLLQIEVLSTRAVVTPGTARAAGKAAQAAATTATAPEAAAVEELAREKSDVRAVDLSGAMRAALGANPSSSRRELPGSPANVSEQDIEKTTFKGRDWDFGRQLVREGGTPMEWMFIDTWYTIGPFPNPKRVNLYTKFPPETVVNLSATYSGKDDREVGWEFLQTGRAQCAPNRSEEYAIYYAYTELWFDQDADLWIVVGSDDKCNLWINDLPVWISGDQLKKWRINEGYRKVYFQKGLNRVLCRIENGWSNTYFSLGIQVQRR